MLILFIVLIRHLLSAQSFLLSPRIPSPTPAKSSPLLAIRHLSNMKECKTILTNQHCQPPYNLYCVSNHQHSWYHLSALSQFCKAVLIFHVYLEILVSYINHQFSFSAESGSRAFSSFLKIHLKTYHVTSLMKHFKEKYFWRMWSNFHHLTFLALNSKIWKPKLLVKCISRLHLDTPGIHQGRK